MKESDSERANSIHHHSSMLRGGWRGYQNMFARVMLLLPLTRRCYWGRGVRSARIRRADGCGRWRRRLMSTGRVGNEFRSFDLSKGETSRRSARLQGKSKFSLDTTSTRHSVRDKGRRAQLTMDSLFNSCCNRPCIERTSSRVNCIKSWSLGKKRMLWMSRWRICSIWCSASSRCWIARFLSCSSWAAMRRLSSASRRQCSED